MGFNSKMDELIGNHWGPKQQFLWDVYLVCCGTFEGKTWWQTIEFLGHLLKTPAMTTRNVNWACWEMLEYYLILFEYTIFVMVWPTKVCDIVAKLRQAVEETRDKPVVSINGSHFLYTTQAGPMPGPPVDPVLPLPSGRHRPGGCQQGQC